MIAGRRRRLVVGAAAVLFGAAAAVSAAVRTTPAEAALQPGPISRGVSVREVTLITGDRLSVDGANNVTVRRAKGREKIPVSINKIKGHVHVTPADALPLVRAGRLDPRLFDVTALLDFGYDDTRPDVPLIVTRSSAASAAARSGSKAARAAKPKVPAGATVVRDLPAAHGVAATAARKDLATLWREIRAGGTGAAAPKIWLDGKRTITVDRSVPQIGAPAAWEAGFTGDGIKVAVVDSGVDGTHPDLAGQVVASRNFVPEDDELDHVGHGTHVAATVAGTGAGRYKGVAPGAKIIAAKVCGLFGCPDSAIIEGMRWAVAEQHADVVNMSLGQADVPEVDPVEQAVQDLTTEFGALFVISAGNAGGDRTVGSPGSVDAALTVGAIDDNEALAPFSSRGPRVGDAALKPDITAPGVDIIAARGKDAEIMGKPGEQYVSSSGTSMSSPHVAGAAAILAQRRPDWDPATLKAGLMASAKANPAIGVFGQGAGRVDVPAAIAQTVTTSPPSISFGRQVWPHADDELLTRTVTYHNHGTAAVTLGLTLELAGGAPQNLFGLNGSTVTVPAGGTADVPVTADTRIDAPDGFFGATVVATPTGGGSVTRTAMAVEKEVESYDVTLAHTNRAGQPADNYYTALQGLDNPYGGFVWEEDGTVVTRVPKGRYFAFSVIADGDVEDPEARIDESFLLQPVVDVSRDLTVTFDARTAAPISVTAPRPDAKQATGLLLASVPHQDGGSFGFGLAADTFDTLFMGAVGGNITLDGLVTKLSGTWAQAGADGAIVDCPYQYDLAWTERNRAITGFSRTVDPRELATVQAKYNAQIPDAVATKSSFSRTEGIDFGGGFAVPFSTPATRTEFVTTRDVWWAANFLERSADEANIVLSIVDRADYKAGRTYRETWNKGMWSPGMPGGYDPTQRGWLFRAGDEIIVNVPTFTDGAGRAGFSSGTGTMTLFRDGVKVGSADSVDGAVFAVEPGRARYRVEVTHSRGAPFETSTAVTGAWEFMSDTTPTDRVTPLDASAVHFTPALDDRTAAPAGRRFTVALSVQKQLASGGGRNRSLAVEVSYDDGTTWLPAPVRTVHGGLAVIVHHPRGRGFVSLRAKAKDTGGNTVQETVIRAYRYGD